MYYSENLCIKIKLASLGLLFEGDNMIKKIFKTIAFLTLSICLMVNNNVVHAGSGQSSAGGTIQGGGGSTGGGGATRSF